MAAGSVVKFGEEGWGFIKPDDGGRDIFMHISDVADPDRDRIAAGQPVVYEVAQGERGPRAINVRLRTGPLPDPPAFAGIPEGELRRELGEVVEGVIERFRDRGWVTGE